jgi:G:T-mismatch repair DNA endonuclease (very short patch repair protein)
LNFVFDFYIPSKNLVIECQGDYWHANPRKYGLNNTNDIQKKNIERDNRKKNYLLKNDIENLFIWEFDIKNNFHIIKKQIKTAME